ncbi:MULTISPECIES: glycerol-3-phosphate responsive antiterminator [unclassified Exiguobacterium]|uniref:glycerol-3-phosphate responsive antiterminator n=1 Tax=unclassified Exiguobacterium TaxID=2644629 RepID=UPI001BEB2C83|nr:MULTISPECIES: glycerol-3-phosphate responsive antiterminator [unclassified Exiguobacterium]
MIQGQSILPAIRDMRDLERFLSSELEVGVLLEIHMSRLEPIFKLLEKHQKKVFIHMDLIQGMKADEFATEYVCQTYRPFGVISTKGNVIVRAKQNHVLTVQRLFLIDSTSLEKSIKHIERSKPDYIEVLPGIVPKYIRRIQERTGIPVFAGGLIETTEEVDAALAAGASVITTSNRKLWTE